MSSLFFRKAGNGFPIIILHGLYGSSDNWQSIANELSKNYLVYSLDLRNHGASPHYNTHTYLDMVEDLEIFFEQQNIDKAIVIGHSMGGKCAMRFALEHPKKIEKLIVIDIVPKKYIENNNFGKSTATHSFYLEKIANTDLSLFKNRTDIGEMLQKEILDKDLVNFFLKNIGRTHSGNFYWKFNASVLRNNLNEILDGFSNLNASSNISTLIIKGGESNYIAADDYFYIRKFFPMAEMATIPNANHWVHAQQPELLIKTILYFIE